MKIIHGPYEIFGSGTITSADLSEIRFVVSENPPMEVVCRVLVDGGEPGANVEVVGDNSIALVFRNPNSIGFGPSKPVRVGHVNGRAFYVSFRVSMRGKNDSFGLEYTFYVGENV